MNHDTLLSGLSSTFYKTLSFLETPEFENIKGDITSLTHMVTSLEHEVLSDLSAIPTHPYELLKYQYFDQDHCFKCLDDLEEPEDIPKENCLAHIKNRNKELMLTSFHNLTCCDEDKCLTAFAFNSGGQMISDHEKQKNYIEFLEIVKGIPITSINKDNCESIAKKLIGEYIKII